MVDAPPEKDEQEEPVPPRTVASPTETRYLRKELWNGLPNYGCPFCDHATPNGPDAVEDHIDDYHPEEAN